MFASNRLTKEGHCYMSMEDYKSAVKLGKKEYQNRLLHGQKPTLEVLDDILPPNEAPSMVSLGLVQIPIDQIVGTRYAGRSSSFAANFMPIMDERTEFAIKWGHLSTAHAEEGIRDPIKAYEYMNKFYVEEGNKRVSVMKYFEAVSIPGTVTRILPRHTEDKENKIYWEYVEFYRYSRINYIYFTRLGSFAKLQAAVGKAPDELWTDDDRITFSSAYTRFTAAYEAKGGDKKIKATIGDAFLAYITLYGYDSVENASAAQLKEAVTKTWDEFELQENPEEVSLKMDPTVEKKPLLKRILPLGQEKPRIAFIYEKTPESSAWTYAHELGRLHLEQALGDAITTRACSQVTKDNVESVLEQAIREGCNLIFTTTPTFAQASVKAAIAHPDVRILNCSLNTSHRYIRTYYARMHEAKFLMGMLAGAMTKTDKLFYLADYPLFGTISHINAFAYGAQMVNPRAKVFLEWTSQKNVNIQERINLVNPDIISGKDMVIPQEEVRTFGLYHQAEDGQTRSLALPICHWGKIYEYLVRMIMDGNWKLDESDSDTRAINYWWGMSSGMVDVVWSQTLPAGVQRLLAQFFRDIQERTFRVFEGVLRSQGGTVQEDAASVMSPERILAMDWLAENVVGKIPGKEELTEQAQPVMNQQGVGPT